MPSNLKPKAEVGNGREGNDPEVNGGKAEPEETKGKKEAKGKA